MSVNTKGAELWDIHTLGGDSVSCLWDGNPELWPRRAPVCFPWCGKVDGGWFSVDGIRYEAGAHGFVRDMEHCLAEQEQIISVFGSIGPVITTYGHGRFLSRPVMSLRENM